MAFEFRVSILISHARTRNSTRFCAPNHRVARTLVNESALGTCTDKLEKEGKIKALAPSAAQVVVCTSKLVAPMFLKCH